MDTLQVPSNTVKILPMDASVFAPRPGKYDDDDEVGLGYQRTLVNIKWIFDQISIPFVLHSDRNSYSKLRRSELYFHSYLFLTIVKSMNEIKTAWLTLIKYRKLFEALLMKFEWMKREILLISVWNSWAAYIVCEKLKWMIKMQIVFSWRIWRIAHQSS